MENIPPKKSVKLINLISRVFLAPGIFKFSVPLCVSVSCLFILFTFISVDESRKCLEDYIKAVDREITKRRQVKDLLEQAKKYYSSLYDEAEVVTNVSYITKFFNIKNFVKLQHTPQKYEVFVPPKRFKICYIFIIRKPA